MKKLRLLLGTLFILTVFNVQAKYKQSDLNLKLWNNATFKVILNNQSFNKTNKFSNQIQPGLHDLKVVRTKRNRNGNGGFNEVLYQGKIKIPKNANVVATVTPNKKIKLRITKKKQFNNGYVNHYGSGYGGNNTYSQYTSYEPASSVNNNYGIYNQAINNYKWNQLTNAMLDACFDSEKLKIAKRALYENDFTTEHVTLLMSHFTFESNKLQFAKLAYDKTIDKKNYFLVNRELAYNSSKNNLNNYINSYF